MSARTRSRSFGCETPEGLRPIERTDSTSGSRRHWRRTLFPTMPVEPKRMTFIHTSAGLLPCARSLGRSSWPFSDPHRGSTIDAPAAFLLRLARHRADRAPRRLPRRCLDVLREDNRAIIRAASQASKAANYILGFLPGGPAQAAGAV